MTSVASLQLRALLAMPATLRPTLLGASGSFRPRWTHTNPRLFSASPLNYGTVKYPNVAALVIPEFRTSSIAEISSDDLFKTSSLSSAPGQPLEDELTKLFTKNPAAFAYAESDFYKLKKNTRVPEVCILGRSNVGKSSFVNAVANRQTNGLAYISSKAGKTRSINTYGFGPAPTIQELQGKAAEYKGEDKPTHTFHLVDMPGYGHASQKEWGKNISLYLNKRNAVKGAIVLIDAEVGPKDSDFHLLQLLSAAQLKTAIVLTKADKVKKGLEGLRETCMKVWDGIRTIEVGITEGNWVWEKDVYVTAVGARDSAVVKSTVTTARLAVARLAGLVKDERPNMERNQRWSGKMIAFDDLQYVPNERKVSETSDIPSNPAEPVGRTPLPSRDTGGSLRSITAFADSDQPIKAQRGRPLRKNIGLGSKNQAPAIHGATRKPALSRWEMMPSPLQHTAGLSKANSGFANLEQAAKAQHSGGSRINTGLGLRGRNKTGRIQARAFYSTDNRRSRGLPRDMPTRDEMKLILDDFIKTLKKEDTALDRVRRLERERMSLPYNPPKPWHSPLRRVEKRRVRYSQRQFPEQTNRTRAIYFRRLKIEENRRQSRAAEDAEAMTVTADTEWPVMGEVKSRKGINEAMDASVFQDIFAKSPGLVDDKKGAYSKKQKLPDEPEVDAIVFEEVFAESPRLADDEKSKGSTEKESHDEPEESVDPLMAMFERGKAKDDKACSGDSSF
jgi:ribosome biogenesis GTP-binding protein YsxC/EngB